MTTAAHDQMQAAIDHARSIMDQAGETLAFDKAPNLLGPDLEAHIMGLLDQATFCPHLAGPQVCFFLLHDPERRVCCAICAAIDLDRGIMDAHPGCCDLCHAPSLTFREIQVQCGPVLVTGNLCPDCDPVED